MIQIYDVDAARRTILQRSYADDAYPPALVESVERIFGTGSTPQQAVTDILNSVRVNGDQALRMWSKRLDGTIPDEFRVAKRDLEAAPTTISPALMAAMSKAAHRIRSFHELQPVPRWTTEILGGTIGQRFTPIERVGVYVPGGTAPLPSSLLMSVIPATVAGVREIIVCTPPNPHPSILAAAQMCDLDGVYQIGGAQAIGAMAFGTESVERVDKIVGAGNLFVTLAKQQVFGIVGLDGLAGPTETMIIADGSARPDLVAADLLAQAEHDVLASAILLTPDVGLAEVVQTEVERQLSELSRSSIIRHSLERKGGIILTPDIDVAVDLANDYAAEHLCLIVEEIDAILNRITNAGGIFLGERSFEVLGDYVAGPSHIMPTGGSARFASPLNVLDFVKITSIIGVDHQTSAELSPAAAEIARAESLTAHAAAADLRVVGKNGASCAHS